MFVCYILIYLLIETLKPLFTNAYFYLWIRFWETTKDEFVVNKIHFHI